MTPQQIASEFQSLVNRVENAEQALRLLGKSEHETCNAFVSRVSADLSLARGNNATLREKVEALSDAYHKHKAEIDTERARADKAECHVRALQEDYDRIVKERDAARARADREVQWGGCAEKQRDAAFARADKAEALVDRIRAERNKDLNVMGLQGKEIEHLRAELAQARDKSIAWHDFDLLKKNVDDAFKVLGKQPDETYGMCAERLSNKYADIVVDYGQLQIRLDEAEQTVAQVNGALRAADAAHAEEMGYVTRAFAILGKRDDETYVQCAERVKLDLGEYRASALESQRRLNETRTILHGSNPAMESGFTEDYAKAIVKERDELKVRLQANQSTSWFSLEKERDDFEDRLQAEIEERIRTLNQLNAMCAQRAEVIEERDAAVAELDRLRKSIADGMQGLADLIRKPVAGGGES